MANKRLIFITPTYFDVESFSMLREDILSTLNDSHFKFNVISFIVIDDSAGQDLKMKELEDLDDVSVITPPFNLGHQRAIVFAIRSCFDLFGTDDIIVTLDSDGEDRALDLPQMIRKSEENHSLVLAKRTKRQESLLFKCFYQIYKGVFKLMTGVIINSGNYAVFSSDFIKKVIYHPSFDLCYSSTLIALNVPKSFVACPRGIRYKGESKMNFRSLIMHGIRMLMPFMDKIATRSLIIFSIGLFLSFIAIAIILSIKLTTSMAIPGWASTLVTTFSVFSFIAIGNFSILFVLFGQGHGRGLRSLENYNPQQVNIGQFGETR